MVGPGGFGVMGGVGGGEDRGPGEDSWPFFVIGLAMAVVGALILVLMLVTS